MNAYLDGHGDRLKLWGINTFFGRIKIARSHTKLIIDFFSIVPFNTGTASSGLSALGRSAGAWAQIYLPLAPLKLIL